MDTIGTGKVVAAGAAGAVMTILAFVLHQLAHVELPAEVVAAGQTLITGLAVYLIPHGGTNA